MRNLKRVLSLVMAAAMLVGLLVVSASAADTYDDFTDKDEIVNTEAVNTMVSLGVITGKEDGSYFDPTGIVTRAEMAALIARCLNGGSDPLLGTGAATTQFSDVASNYWAAPYIAYCANLGIINGKGDGTFGPEEPVTGTAAAKMFLCALGYRSDIEGLTGTGWDLNSDQLANKVGLYDDMSITPSDGLNRDNTAQLIYNGVQADEVEYRNNYGEYQGVIYAQPKNGVDNDSTMLWERFKVRKVEGVVEATSLISLVAARGTTVEGKTRLNNIEYNGEEYVDNNDNPIPVTYPIAIDSDLLGQRVVIYVKGLNNLAPNASSMEVVGTAIVSDDNTVVDTSARLKDDDAVKDALKGSGILVDTNAPGITITWDDTAKVGANNGYTGVTPAAEDGNQYPGMNQRFIDNNADGTVDVIIRTQDTLTKVNTYNATTEKLNLSGIGTVDFVDVLNPEDVEQGDYVLVYNYDDTYVLEAVETVSGEVSAFVNNAKDSFLSKITVDGTNYGWSNGENLAPDVLDKINTPGADLEDLVDGAYTLYLDKSGNMLGYVEDEGAIGDYAVITGVNSTGHTNGFYAAEVKVIMSDGTTGKYDVNLLASANKYFTEAQLTGLTNGQKERLMYEELTGDTAHNGTVVAANSMLDTLVSYAISDNTITLIDPDVASKSYSGITYNNPTGKELELQNSKAGYGFGANGSEILMADDRTVFFFKDTKDAYSAVSGLSNVRASGLTAETGSNSQAIYYQPAGNATMAARAIFVIVDEEFTSNSNYAYISGDYTRTTEGNDTVYSYPVVSEAGDPGTLKTKTAINGAAKEKVHEYQNDGDYVNFGTDDKMINDKVVIGVGNNSITVADAENVNTGKASYPTSGATVWNVEDVASIFDTSFQLNDKVALVLDEDYKVRTGFVYDRQDGEMVGEPTDFTVDTNGNGAVFAVNAGDTLPVSVTPAPGTYVKSITASLDGGTAEELYKATGAVADLVGDVVARDYDLPDDLEDGRYTLTLKATVADPDEVMNDLTETITVTLVVGTSEIVDKDEATEADLAGIEADEKVLVNGNLTVSATGLTLPAGAVVEVNGDATLNGDVKGGKLIVSGKTTVADGKTVDSDVDTASLELAGGATIKRTVNVTGEGVDVTLKGTTTINGALILNGGDLILNKQTLNGTGTVNGVDVAVLGSKIGGTVTVNANSAIIVGDFEMDGGTLNIDGDVANQAAETATIEVSGGTLSVGGTVEANLTISGTADVTVTESVTGTVSNTSTGEVTIGGEETGKVEPMTDEVKTATLFDTRNNSEDEEIKAEAIAAEDLVGDYTVTGTKSSTTADSKTITTYDLTLTATDLKYHLNGDDPQNMGYWAGVMVQSSSGEKYVAGYGSYTEPDSWTQTVTLDTGSDTNFSMYWNFGIPTSAPVWTN